MPIDSPGVCLLTREDQLSQPDVAAAVEELRQAGVDLDVRAPSSSKVFKERIVNAIDEGASRIVVGGGDGTLNAAVDVLMSTGAPKTVSLGLLPLGTGNDFAKSAGIDAGDPLAALALACTGRSTRIDVGQMNDSYFVNTASIGFGAQVTATTPDDLKKVLGAAAYSIMGLVRAFQAESRDGRLILPDGETVETRFLMMLVGNGRFAGGGFEVAPRANLTDGLLDVAVITDPSPDSIRSLLDELNDPTHPRNEPIYYRQVAGLRLETKEPLHVTLDGEPTSVSRFDFRCHPKAISMVLGGTPSTP
jgi:lipid kinase YegS